MATPQEVTAWDEKGNPVQPQATAQAAAWDEKGNPIPVSLEPTQFEKDRPGKGISTEGMGGAAWESIKQIPGAIGQMLDPTRGLSGAALGAIGLNPRSGGTSARMGEVPAMQMGREIASAYRDPDAKWWEVPLAGLSPLVGMSAERAREHARRGEGGAIMGEAAVPAALTMGGPLVGKGLKMARPALQRAAFKELPTSGAPQLTRGARSTAMLMGSGLGAVAGGMTPVPGGAYIGGHTGLLVGPSLMESMIGTPEVGNIRNPGPFSKIPMRAPVPKMITPRATPFEGMASSARPGGEGLQLPPVMGEQTPFPLVTKAKPAGVPKMGTTGGAAKPFEPLIWESPAEAASHDLRMKNLQRQASAAGTYHAAQGATKKRLNLQQRIQRTEE